MYLSGPTALAVFHGAAEVARIIYIELTGKAMRSSNNSLRTSVRGVHAPHGGDNLMDANRHFALMLLVLPVDTSDECPCDPKYFNFKMLRTRYVHRSILIRT
jgi:hypothetical protein